MAATGDYLLFADSDDMLPEDAVEKLARKADSSHADLIDGGYREWCEGKAGRLQKPFDVSDNILADMTHGNYRRTNQNGDKDCFNGRRINQPLRDKRF